MQHCGQETSRRRRSVACVELVPPGYLYGILGDNGGMNSAALLIICAPTKILNSGLQARESECSLPKEP